MLTLLIPICLASMTTQQAADFLYQTPAAWQSMQTCMDELRNQRFYTDVCISRQFPGTPLLVVEKFENGELTPVDLTIQNGQLLSPAQ